MLKITLSTILLALMLVLTSSAEDHISILPLPVSMKTTGEKSFQITDKTPIIIEATPEAKKSILSYAKENLPRLKTVGQVSAENPPIVFSLVEKLDNIDSEEGYQLIVTPEKIEIKASGEAGLFYGLITLIQLA